MSLVSLNKETNVRIETRKEPLRLTYVGTATVLLEVAGLRVITDPVFDPAGTRYRVGRTELLTHTHWSGPAMEASDLPEIDLALVSHDHHKDNLDREGRRLLLRVHRTLTTVPGGRRLRDRFGVAARGLAPWESVVVESPSGQSIKITATPARHGPRWMKPLVGEVVGFALEPESWEGQALWISGDTVWFSGLEEIRRRFDVSVALVHVGAARFAATGPIRYTLDAAELVRVGRLFDQALVVPIHFEGWSHFREGRREIERAAAGSAESDLTTRLLWLERGKAWERGLRGEVA